jgi:hypothetical protein
MNKSCGSCSGFVKLKNDKYSGGLCGYLDHRTNTDSGSNCVSYAGKKYNRLENIKMIQHVLKSDNS